MNTFLSSLSTIIPLHFTPLGTLCSLNKIISWCPWPIKLLAVFLPLWWVLFGPLNFLLHILLCTAQVLSLKKVICLLLRFLLPPVCWCFPKHILILDFFLELQNLGSSCPFDIIIKMSYWHLNRLVQTGIRYSPGLLILSHSVSQGSNQTKSQRALSSPFPF